MESAPAVLSPVSQAQADEPQPQIHLEREQSVHLTELQPVQPVQLPSIENMVNVSHLEIHTNLFLKF